MLISSRRRQVALNVPVILGFTSALFLGGGVVSFLAEPSWGSGFSLLFGLGVVALALNSLRWIFLLGSELVVGTVYGESRMNRDTLALGMKRHSGGRGGRTYTIYASGEGAEMDLAEALSEKGAEGHRTRITEVFLEGRLPSGVQSTNQQVADAKETTWRQQDDQARAYVDQYYGKNGSTKSTVLVMLGVFVLMVIGVGMTAWLSR